MDADGRALGPAGHRGAVFSVSPGLWLHCDLSNGSVDGTAAPGAPPEQAQGAVRSLGSVAAIPQLLTPRKWGRLSPGALALALT